MHFAAFHCSRWRKCPEDEVSRIPKQGALLINSISPSDSPPAKHVLTFFLIFISVEVHFNKGNDED